METPTSFPRSIILRRPDKRGDKRPGAGRCETWGRKMRDPLSEVVETPSESKSGKGCLILLLFCCNDHFKLDKNEYSSVLFQGEK